MRCRQVSRALRTRLRRRAPRGASSTCSSESSIPASSARAESQGRPASQLPDRGPLFDRMICNRARSSMAGPATRGDEHRAQVRPSSRFSDVLDLGTQQGQRRSELMGRIAEESAFLWYRRQSMEARLSALTRFEFDGTSSSEIDAWGASARLRAPAWSRVRCCGTKRADRNAPAATVDAKRCQQETEKRLRRTNDSRSGRGGPARLRSS